jgi:hypothetical protein
VDEVAVVTREKDFNIHAFKGTPRAYLVVFPRKLTTFRIFNSDPSVLLKRNVTA